MGQWSHSRSGFVLEGPGEPDLHGRVFASRFYVDVGHSLPGLWFASERSYPGGILVARETFQGPAALEAARKWCEDRLTA